MTSHDVIKTLKKRFLFSKIGYAGTLDPMATGVLAICTGSYTRLIQYFDKNKAYQAGIQLGLKTDSYDITGTIIHTQQSSIEIQDIEAILPHFSGRMEQTPPVFSAIHYKGKRLYEYARANIEVPDIPVRQVIIYNTQVLSWDQQEQKLILDIHCSEGTYIRSIAHDLGEKLKVGGCLYSLVRTLSSGITLDQCCDLESLLNCTSEQLFQKCALNPIDMLDLPVIALSPEEIQKIHRGLVTPIPDSPLGLIGIKTYDHKLVSIGESSGNSFTPYNNFC